MTDVGKGSTLESVAVLCTHNGERYIHRQLLSMIQQTERIGAIFLYDFRSSDGTVAKARRFAAAHPGVRLKVTTIDQVRGPCWSFLFALRACPVPRDPATLVYLCDQDDSWFPEKNAKVLRAARHLQKQTDYFLIHHDVVPTDEVLRPRLHQFYDLGQKQLLASGADQSMVFNTVVGHTTALSGALVGLLDTVEYSPNFIMHEWVIAAVAEAFGRREFLPEKLSYYRLHGGNIVGYQDSSSSTWRRGIGLLAYAGRIARQAAALHRELLRVQRAVSPPPPSAATLSSTLWSILYSRLRAAPTMKLRLLALAVLIRHAELVVCRVLRQDRQIQ